MRLQAKICGLSTPETVDAAIRGGASHIGLNFFPPSPRHIGFDLARSLAARTPPRVRKVGVFVDPCNALLEQAIEAGSLDIVQLYMTTPARTAAIREITARETWAAVSVRKAGDLDAAKAVAGAADFILYDAAQPDSAPLPGGMGTRFDWSLLEGFSHPLPWGLAGGLTAGNIAEAVRATRTSLVDTSSGVESAPGIKDVDKIAAFLKAAARL